MNLGPLYCTYCLRLKPLFNLSNYHHSSFKYLIIDNIEYLIFNNLVRITVNDSSKNN